MKANLYICASSCISPQQTFGSDSLPENPVAGGDGLFKAVEPDYREYLNIPAARRMSRLIKMGVTSALHCLNRGGVKIPDAIIAGTGLGCMEDSEKFLASLILNKEQTLSPTSFIFSTHNTVAAQIALLLQCNNYNFTHTHRGLSFEHTLSDAHLFLKDRPDALVLAGASDEVTPTSFKILQRLGAAKSTPPGEGSAFFLLSNDRTERSLAKISALSTLNFPRSDDQVLEWIATFCQKHPLTSTGIFLTGVNGDPAGDEIYFLAAEKLQLPAARYKHLCGEYHTSTAFAAWAAATMLHDGQIPSHISLNDSGSGGADQVLIFNHYKRREFSLILLEKC